MTVAYFDCFSGISGDMTLGALVDAGLEIDTLRSELAKLDLTGYALRSEKVTRAGLAATKVFVDLAGKKHPARRLPDVRSIIEKSALSDGIKKTSISIFGRLADAEAKVHGTTREQVHFHEVGAVDAIVDIVGTAIGLDRLGITTIVSSPVNLGSGTVKTAHGILPVPAPATTELLRNAPVYGSDIDFEFTTPTGAAIISTLARTFGPLPSMRVSNVACGAGDRDLPGRSNVLRILIGESAALYDEDSSVLIETNVDDMNPQIYGYLIERLLDAGAHDAYLAPIVMKKGRPGVLLSVLGDAAKSDTLLDIIFRETTSIGVRIQHVGRKKLTREIREVETTYGSVRMKISRRGDEVLTATPEYEDCKKIAEEKRVPLKQVMEEAKNLFSRGGAEDAKENKSQ